MSPLLADAVQAVREALRPRWGLGHPCQVISGPPPEHGDRAPAPGPDLGRADVLDLSVELQDAAGRRCSKPLSHQVRLPPSPRHPLPPISVSFGRSPSTTSFGSEGSYSFVISVDGDLVSRLRFSVRARPTGSGQVNSDLDRVSLRAVRATTTLCAELV